MGVEKDRQGGESQVSATLVKLLSTPETHRQPEDVFEIANGLFRASFVQQLDVCIRAKIAHCAKLYEIVPGALIPFHEKGESALYIVLSGSVKVEDAGLEFFSGDTFGFRPPASPTFQLMAGLRVVTCAKKGVAAKVDFDDCVKICVNLFITPPHGRVNHLAPACYHHALIHCQPYGREKIWPEVRDDNGDNDELPGAQAKPPSSFMDLVWSPKLAESILLRGGAKGNEVPIALEFLNFPPVNGYSKELRKILVSQFVMLRAGRGHVFCKWFNALPINPSDVQLSRIHFDSVVIVISGSLVATCRRRGDHQARHTSVGSGVHSVTIAGDSAFLPKKQEANMVDGDEAGPSKVKDNISKNTGDGRGGQFVIMRLMAGDVFLPRSGQMQGGQQQRDDSVVDQQVA